MFTVVLAVGVRILEFGIVWSLDFGVCSLEFGECSDGGWMVEFAIFILDFRGFGCLEVRTRKPRI